MATVKSRRVGSKTKAATKTKTTTTAEQENKAAPIKTKAKTKAKSSPSVAAKPATAAKSAAKSTAKSTPASKPKKAASKSTSPKTITKTNGAEASATKGSKSSKSSKPKTKTTAKPSPQPTGENATTKAASPKNSKSTSGAAAPRVKRGGKVPVLPREFLFELARAIRDAVAPHARAGKGREIVSKSKSGDATFQLDRYAEKALLAFLQEKNEPIAYYSEDSGYTTFNNETPQHLLIVDPIDGSRAAKSGFEGCVVAIACTRVMERPTIKDLDNGCVLEIIGDRLFYAERGKGVRMWQGEQVRKPKLSPNDDLETLTWAMTVPARPAELIFPTAGRLIDISSLKGGFFACNSTSYSLTRLLTGQLDAYVDFANRFLRDIPDVVKNQFINAGRGEILGIVPYDMAAALLIAEEAGCVITDAYGKRFDDVMLLDSTVDNHQTIIAAGNSRMHKTLLKFFDKRIKQFEQLYLHRNHK